MELQEFLREFERYRRSVPTDREFLVAYPFMEARTIDMYYQVFGRKIKIRCSTCIMDYFFELKALTEAQIKNLMELKFKLKEKALVEVDNNHYTVQSKHLTNDIGMKIYKKYGARVFDNIDVKAMAGKEEKPEPKKPETTQEHIRAAAEREPQKVEIKKTVAKKPATKRTTKKAKK